jgi:hypothetical protein
VSRCKASTGATRLQTLSTWYPVSCPAQRAVFSHAYATLSCGTRELTGSSVPQVPEHVKKRFAAAAAMLNEQNDRRRSPAAPEDRDGVGGGQSVAASEAVRKPAGGWDADKCTSTEQGRAGGEGEERRADGAD